MPNPLHLRLPEKETDDTAYWKEPRGELASESPDSSLWCLTGIAPAVSNAVLQHPWGWHVPAMRTISALSTSWWLGILLSSSRGWSCTPASLLCSLAACFWSQHPSVMKLEHAYFPLLNLFC